MAGLGPVDGPQDGVVIFSVMHNWKLKPPAGIGPLMVKAPVEAFKLI